MKRIILFSIIVFVNFSHACTSNTQNTKRDKLNCFARELDHIKKQEVYLRVMEEFIDTFKTMRNDKRYFGDPTIVTNQIDEAVFFNKEKTECVLIVLKRNNYNLVFGTARIVRGIKSNNSWIFKPSIEYTFSNDYFDHYRENSFEALSTLARYNVLTDGNRTKKGCDIDEHYWFFELKK